MRASLGVPGRPPSFWKDRRMQIATVLGLVAGLLTTVAFLPQVVRVWRRRSAADLSFPMLAIFCSGVALWLYYGLLVSDLPMIATNTVTLVLAGMLVIMKLRFG